MTPFIFWQEDRGKKREKKKNHRSPPTTSSCTHAALTERG